MPLEQPDHRDRDPCRYERVALLEYVIALLDRLEDRCVGARPPDPALLERLHERGFRVARRRLGRVAFHLERQAIQPLALPDRREQSLLVGQLGVGIVAPFDVCPQIAGEVDRLAPDLERRAPALDRDRHAPAPRVGHLARHRALPDELEEPVLLVREIASEGVRQLERVPGGADRFVGLLGVLHARLVGALRGR